MGKVKSLLPEGFSPPTAEPLYYPGELEAELEKAYRQHELSHYTDEELYDEVFRRALEPLNEAIKDLQAFCDKYSAPF